MKILETLKKSIYCTYQNCINVRYNSRILRVTYRNVRDIKTTKLNKVTENSTLKISLVGAKNIMVIDY